MSKRNSSANLPVYLLGSEIGQQLSAYGDSATNDDQTVKYVEDILRDQLGDIIVNARKVASRRTISVEDILFVIRHNALLVARIKVFLSWKDIRKKAAKGSDADPAIISLPPESEEHEDLADLDNAAEASVPAHQLETAPQYNRTLVACPWDLQQIYVPNLPLDSVEKQDDLPSAEALEAEKRRLQREDALSAQMTAEEYQIYSENKQASFTFQKQRKFKELICYSALAHSDASDEVVDLLGFLAHDLLRTMCESICQSKMASRAGSTLLKRVRSIQEAEAAKAAKIDTSEDRPTGPFSRLDEANSTSAPGPASTPGVPSRVYRSSESMRPDQALSAVRRLQRQRPAATSYGFQNWSCAARRRSHSVYS